MDIKAVLREEESRIVSDDKLTLLGIRVKAAGLYLLLIQQSNSAFDFSSSWIRSNVMGIGHSSNRVRVRCAINPIVVVALETTSTKKHLVRFLRARYF